MINAEQAQISSEQLAAALTAAVSEAVKQRERSGDRHLQIATSARRLPTDSVDGAFEAMLRLLLKSFSANVSDVVEVLVVAEQAADRTGADRFSTKTRSFIQDIVSERDSYEITKDWPPKDRATFRARLLTLARTVGLTVAWTTLKAEKELQSAQPLMWLDLTNSQTATPLFVDMVADKLCSGAFHAFSLIPRLKSISRFHGPGAIQSILDRACENFYRYKDYEAADELIARANTVLPMGWRVPLGGGTTFVSHQLSGPEQGVDALIKTLKVGAEHPVRVVRIFREQLDPLLSVSADVSREQSRAILRQRLFNEIPQTPSFDALLLTGIHPRFRLPNYLNFDWWQDLGPWTRNVPSKQQWIELATSPFAAEAERIWASLDDAFQSKTAPLEPRTFGFELIAAAESLKFGAAA